jgi:hypothetical protein
MSHPRDCSDQSPSSGQVRGFFTRKVTRFLLCIGLVVGLTAAPVGGLAVASASPVASGHHSRGGGFGIGGFGLAGFGFGGGFGMGGGGFFNFGHHHHAMSIVNIDGTVLSGGAGSDFTLTATSSSLRSLRGTAVTVDVTSSTTYTEPGVSSPSVAVGDLVNVSGMTTSTTGTITANNVQIPGVQITGDVTSGGAGAAFALTTTSTTIYGPKGTTVTVDVNAGGVTTKYIETGTTSPSVAVGDKVQVFGSQAGTATVDASLVIITAPKRHHRHIGIGLGGIGLGGFGLGGLGGMGGLGGLLGGNSGGGGGGGGSSGYGSYGGPGGGSGGGSGSGGFPFGGGGFFGGGGSGGGGGGGFFGGHGGHRGR